MRRAGPGWVRGGWGGACHCRPQRHGSWLCRLLWSTASLRGASFLSADRPAAPGHARALQSLADTRARRARDVWRLVPEGLPTTHSQP